MNLEGYVPVNDRLLMALGRHPQLRVHEENHKLVEIGDRTFIEASVLVYRDAEDSFPTRGTVWEPFPGKTAFQRDSELMVAYTSALGRALGYMGFGIERGIASVDEIIARTEDPDQHITRIDHRKKATIGSRASKTLPETPNDPEEPARPAGMRTEPTEKMMAFLEKLNVERGNPLSGPDLARCSGNFELCRTEIDRLQEMPKVK